MSPANPPAEADLPARLAEALARRGVPFTLDVGGDPVRWRFHLGGGSILELDAAGAGGWLVPLPAEPAALAAAAAAAFEDAGLG
ncbi:hypothetical protein [Phenylobacterium sp.]|uniref:hypothetical protein n=1 Tax=Phenylobacterium sp. TaxID=1871053 RepID=UPI0035B3BCD7